MRKFLLSPLITRPNSEIAQAARMKCMLLVSHTGAAVFLHDPHEHSLAAVRPSILRSITPILFHSGIRLNNLLWCYSAQSRNWKLNLANCESLKPVQETTHLLKVVGKHLGQPVIQDREIEAFITDIQHNAGGHLRAVCKASDKG